MARSVFTRRCGRWGWSPVPSTASLSRIFRDAGVARIEPRKKPRSSYRRFVYPAPNACWQLDATEYVLTGGRKCVIFQLIDDHSRFAIASHVAWGETSEGAIAVVKKGIAGSRGPAAAALRQRRGAEPVPPRRARAAGRLPALARRRTDHREALQTDHAGQERTVPSDPVPLPRQAAPRRHPRAAAGPGRRRSTSSTTPSDPTKAFPAGSPRSSLGRDARRPNRPARHPAAPLPAPSEEIRVKLVGNTGAVEFRGIRFGIGRAFAEQRVCVMDAGQDRHDLRPPRHPHHRAPLAQTRHQIRQQRPNPGPAKPSNVSDVLIHQLSEMS